MPGQVVRVQVFHPNQGRLPIFDPRQIQCVYQRVDPESTHHFLRFQDDQNRHWVDPNYELFESKNNFQANFWMGGYFNPIPYLNVQQGLKKREMNQLPTVIDSHTPTYLSELHNVHLTPIYELYRRTTPGVLPTQRRFGIHA